MSSTMIDWLYGLQHFGVKLGLDNIRALLDRLNHPESHYDCVLVAGTNGKGSVAAMMESILRAAGCRTGMFSSPHLVRPTERVRLDGNEIRGEALDRLLAEMRDTIQGALDRGDLEVHPSFFEVITATSLVAFRDHRADAAVLEVGLGGRLDATNAVEAELSVIVSIDLDHTKTLGETVEQIATEKGGIIKPGRPVISGVTRPEARATLQAIARERGATWIDAHDSVSWVDIDAPHATGDEPFTLRGRRDYTGIRLALPGRHQIDNARVAVAACECLAEGRGFALQPEAVRRGLATVRWPGRLQWIPSRNGWPRLLLDSAHNQASMRTLVDYLRPRERPAALVFGATVGKPVDVLLESLSRIAERVVITRPPVDKGLDPQEVAELARRRFAGVEVREDPGLAVQCAGAAAGEDGYVLVTGSLYLVGEILGRIAGEAVPGPVAM